MDLAAIDESSTQVEIFSLVAVAVVVGVFLGPGAITVEGTDSMWIEALSAALIGVLAFVAGALSLGAVKRQ